MKLPLKRANKRVARPRRLILTLQQMEDRSAPTDLFGVITNDLLTGDILVIDPDPFAETATKSTETIFPLDDGSTFVTGMLPATTDDSHTQETTSVAISNTIAPDQTENLATSSGYDILIPATAFLNPLPNPLPSPLDEPERTDQPSPGGGLSDGLAAGVGGGGGDAAGGYDNSEPGASATGGGGSADNSATGGGMDFSDPGGAVAPSGNSANATASESVIEASTGSVARQTSLDKLAGQPIAFEENRGQTDSRVQFLARNSGYTMYLTGASVVLALAKPDSLATANAQERSAAPRGRDIDVVAMNFVGANANARVVGQDELPSRSAYFIGNEKLRDIPHFRGVQVTNLYDGIDAVFYGDEQGKLEYDLVVHPGANPAVAQLQMQGVRGLSLDLGGNLRLDTSSDGKVVQQKPVAYQMIDGVRQEVLGSYVPTGTDRVGFAVGAYNPNYALVIDPVLDYGSYLGGSGDDEGLAIAVNGAGDMFVTGKTLSTNFPMQEPFQSTLQGGTDAFVSRLDTFGNLVYSTYLGGSGNEQGNGIAVDQAGNAFVVGTTASSNFPTTAGAYDTSLGGTSDAFVVKLSSTGNALYYGTFLGGTAADTGTAVAVDASGQAYVTGDTAGGAFPTTVGAFQTTFGGGATDAFVTAINDGGTALVYSGLLGGANAETGYGIALDSNNVAYVTGSVSGSGFPTTTGVVQTAFGGGAADAFLAAINAAGSAKVYATYLGGSGEDRGYAVSVSSDGKAAITGRADSGWTTTSGAAQTTFGGGLSDGMITQLNAAGTSRLYSSYVGGSGDDEGRGLGIALDGKILIAGKTSSTNFPTANPLQSTNAGGTDAFVTRVTPTSGSGWSYSTYLGGSGNDSANGLDVDLLGDAYVTGGTLSTNFPTSSPFQSSNAGGSDAFLSKIIDGVAPPVFTGISDDTGSSGSDRITTDQTLIFSGTAPAGATVKINRRGVGEIGSVTANPTTGAWTFDYSATTLSERGHAFTATATVSSQTSAPTKEFLVSVDRTSPSVVVTVPVTTTSLAPQVRITANDLYGLANGTQVRIDVDLNNDGDYIDTGETNHTTSTLTDGMAILALTALAATGTYRVRSRVTDKAGNEGTSADKTFTVNAATTYSVATATVRKFKGVRNL